MCMAFVGTTSRIAYCGEHTFPKAQEGQMIIELFRYFCEDLPEGNTVFGDSRFTSAKVLAWAKQEYGFRITFTISGTSTSRK